MTELMFKRMVLQHFKPFYKEVDSEHGISHIMDVMGRALDMNHKLGLSISKFDIIVASVAHDIFSYTDRDEHHTKAQEYILNDDSEIYQYVTSKESIAYAVGQHRASYKGEYYDSLAELISAADRDIPLIEKIVTRIYNCAIDPNLIFSMDEKGIPELMLPTGESLSDAYVMLLDNGYSVAEAKTFVHLYEKYSLSGYARYNSIYKRYYKDYIFKLYSDIERIAKDPNELRKYITCTN